MAAICALGMLSDPLAAQTAGVAAEVDANLAESEDGSPARVSRSALEVSSEEAAEEPEALTEYLHVAGSTFVPMHSASGVEYSPWGCTYMTGPEHTSNYQLDLPYDTTITHLRLYFDDTSVDFDGTLKLARYDDGGGGSYLVELTSSGSSGLGNVVAGLALQLDYVNNSYVLYWDVPAAAGSTVKLCGFQVGYIQPRIFADGFEVGNTSNWSSTSP